MIRLLRALHRDRRGQVVPLFLLGLLSLVVAVAMILNTARLVHNRTRAQNSADAAAITQASWAARSMNVVSMNNVGLVHVFTTYMIGNAFGTIWREALQTATQKLNEALRCEQTVGQVPVAGDAVCLAHDLYAIYMGTIVAQLTSIESRYAVQVHGLPTSLRLIGGFNRMSDYAVDEFPRFTWEVAQRMGEVNGVDQVLFHPMSEQGRNDARYQGTGIPVAGGTFGPGRMDALCKVAEEGPGSGDARKNFAFHGYVRGAGPYTRSKEDPGWILTATRLTDTLPIPGDWPLPTSPQPLAALANQTLGVPLPTFGAFWIDWDSEWTTTQFPLLPPPLLVPYATPLLPWPIFPPKGVSGAWDDAQHPLFDGFLGNSNDYADEMRGNWNDACQMFPFSAPVTLSRPKLFRLKPSSLACQGASFVGATALNKTCLRDDLALMAFAVREEEPMVLPSRFENPPGGVYAYAQAHVYNLVSYDLFTQAWGARLEPARWMDDGGTVVEIRESLRREASFGPLEDVLRQLSAVDLERINAH